VLALNEEQFPFHGKLSSPGARVPPNWVGPLLFSRCVPRDSFFFITIFPHAVRSNNKLVFLDSQRTSGENSYFFQSVRTAPFGATPDPIRFSFGVSHVSRETTSCSEEFHFSLEHEGAFTPREKVFFFSPGRLLRFPQVLGFPLLWQKASCFPSQTQRSKDVLFFPRKIMLGTLLPNFRRLLYRYPPLFSLGCGPKRLPPHSGLGPFPQTNTFLFEKSVRLFCSKIYVRGSRFGSRRPSPEKGSAAPREAAGCFPTFKHQTIPSGQGEMLPSGRKRSWDLPPRRPVQQNDFFPPTTGPFLRFISASRGSAILYWRLFPLPTFLFQRSPKPFSFCRCRPSNVSSDVSA